MAVALAAQQILLGEADVIVAGGMESMSNVPYLLDKARTGYKLGNGTLTDGLVKDGLWDVYNDYHMGNAAELCARDMKITREQQDDFAIESYKRSAAAHTANKFDAEMIAVEIPQRGKDAIFVTTDEEFTKVNFDKVRTLKPVFEKDGTVTAANASTLNDGASALVLMSGDKVKELGLKPLAKILAFADAAQAPEWFTTAPALAAQQRPNLEYPSSGLDIAKRRPARFTASITTCHMQRSWRLVLQAQVARLKNATTQVAL